MNGAAMILGDNIPAWKKRKKTDDI